MPRKAAHGGLLVALPCALPKEPIRLGRDGHELNAETLVDQEPHVSPDLSKPFTGTLHRRTVTPRLRPRPAADRIGLGKARAAMPRGHVVAAAGRL